MTKAYAQYLFLSQGFGCVPQNRIAIIGNHDEENAIVEVTHDAGTTYFRIKDSIISAIGNDIKDVPGGRYWEPEDERTEEELQEAYVPDERDDVLPFK